MVMTDEERSLARMSGHDLVAYVDDDSLRDLLRQRALHPLRVWLGVFSGLMAAIVYLLVTGRHDLGGWVATFGPFGTALACHVALHFTWQRHAGDAGLNAPARARLRQLISRAPMPLTPTSDSVDAMLRHLRGTPRS
jgi:hypothetical protein